jgi:hypothetical protein
MTVVTPAAAVPKKRSTGFVYLNDGAGGRP